MYQRILKPIIITFTAGMISACSGAPVTPTSTPMPNLEIRGYVERVLRLRDGISWPYLYRVSGAEACGMPEDQFRSETRRKTEKIYLDTKAFGGPAGLNAYPGNVDLAGNPLSAEADYTVVFPEISCD